MRVPKAFSYVGQKGTTYRAYVNSQTGYWFVSYNIGPKRIRKTLNAETKVEAEHALRLLDDEASQPAHAVVQQHFYPMAWSEFQKRYLEYKGNQGKAQRTLDRYRASLDAFGRYLRKCRVEDIHYITLQILEGYNQYRTKKEECDSKTAYNDALTIKNAMKWGSRASRGLLRVNPSADWETPKPIKPKRRCYTAEEVAAMETGVREWLRPIVTTLAYTGLRIGELIHLRWVDVDLEKRVIHVRVQEEWKPKGRRDRLIPLHPKVEGVIRARPVGTHVFLGPDGGCLKENYALYCLKSDQRKKLKMPTGDLHAFRRFFATTMMKAGVNVESVRQWGGWQSLDTMLRYLADVDVKESVDAMDQAAQKIALA